MVWHSFFIHYEHCVPFMIFAMKHNCGVHFFSIHPMKVLVNKIQSCIMFWSWALWHQYGLVQPFWRNTVYLMMKMKQSGWEFGWLCRKWIRKWPICAMSGNREQQRPSSWTVKVVSHCVFVHFGCVWQVSMTCIGSDLIF